MGLGLSVHGLLNQLIMVAADVDNDLFKSGEVSDGSAGDAIAQLTYRVTSLFSGRDKTLGLSAGLKHFGKRRLGRSGLDRNYPVPDNVWDIDCSTIISPDPPESVHRAYFTEPPVLTLMEQILKGVDRRELLRLELIPAIHRTA
jgi:esterase/lipase superfamily enzyme